MKVWVFQRIASVSDSYHGGGGLAVVASSPTEAKKLMRRVNGTPVTEGYEWGPKVAIDVDAVDFRKATATYEAGAGAEPRVFVFPDAGCC